MRHREQEDLRRHTEGFKPNYMDNVSTVEIGIKSQRNNRAGNMLKKKKCLFNWMPSASSSPPPLQREQEMRGGELGPRGAVNMGGKIFKKQEGDI